MNNAEETRHTLKVRAYYDRNTERFLRWGTDEGTANLHAALWPPEVTCLKEAMNYTNELIAREIERCPNPVNRVLDLGCGVGGSLFYLARRLPRVQSFTGISLSPVQITHARRRVPAGLMGRVRFEEGCFSGLPAGRIEAEAAYAIEALAHASEPEDFFRVQARVLPPRGRLIVIDDCLREDPPAVAIPERQRRLLDCYQRNWLLPGLRSPSALEAVAGPSGFRLITNIDLTPWLRLKRPRDRLISLCVKWFGPLMERNTYFQSLVGGDAKQRCYAVGLTHYRLLVFERCAPPA